jgi:hypothetical protein
MEEIQSVLLHFLLDFFHLKLIGFNIEPDIVGVAQA